jgi:hypothetical protein
MTFFEQELRNTVGAIYPDAKYIGRAAYVDLGGENRAKFEFVTLGYADHYEAIKASILSRSDGVMDSVLLRFADLFAAKKLPMGHGPHAWTNCGKTAWYGFTPTDADYDNLIAAVSDYTELFEVQAPVMRQEQTM